MSGAPYKAPTIGQTRLTEGMKAPLLAWLIFNFISS